MINTFSKLKIQVNLLKLLNETGKPSSAVSKGTRGYHLQVVNRCRRKGVANDSAPFLFEVMHSNGCLPGVIGRLKSTNYLPLRRVSSASSYLDFVDAEAVKDEIKDKIYKLLFPNKVINMVDYFRKRKTDDKGPVVKEQPVATPKTKPAHKVTKPKLKPTPSRKNYASFIATSQQKVILPKVVNVNGVEVINGKIVLDKLEKQKELIKKEEEEVQRIMGNKKLSSREYVYMLNKKHRLASVKPNKIAVNPKSLKAAAKKAEGVEKETGRTAPPRKDYSLFLTRKAPQIATKYSLHGIELFKGSSILANQAEASDPKANKVLYFDHYDNKVAIKVPTETREGKLERVSFRRPPTAPPTSSPKIREEGEATSDVIKRRQQEFF